MFRIRIPIRSRRAPGWLDRTAAGFGKLLAGAAAASLAVSCIERSNPFDPINSAPPSVFDRLLPRLDSIAAGADAYPGYIEAYRKVFGDDSAANGEIDRANRDRKEQNRRTDSTNAATRAANDGASPDSLRELGFNWFVDTLRHYGPYASMGARRNALRAQTADISAYIANANFEHSPSVVFSKAFADSVLAPFLSYAAAFDRLQARIDSADSAVKAANSELSALNAGWAAANGSVAAYNDSISFLRQSFNRPIVTRSDSISRAMGTSRAGDTILIGPGSFAVDLRFGDSGTAENPIVVRGYPGGRTVLRAARDRDSGTIASSVLILSGDAHIRFQDLVFRGASISSVKLEGGSRDISFRDCLFDSSGSYGLEVVDSDVKLADCRLIGNGKGAFLQGREGGTARVVLDNVLIARNRGTGLDLLTPNGSIANATIADNGGDGINLKVPSSELSILNSIIAANGGTGILRVKETNYQTTLSVNSCDLWENGKGDWGLEGLDSAAAAKVMDRNFNLEPGFVDPSGLAYGIRPDSRLAELERVPIVIGYRP